MLRSGSTGSSVHESVLCACLCCVTLSVSTLLAVEERRKPGVTGGPGRGDLPIVQYATPPVPIVPVETVDIQLPLEDRKIIYGKWKYHYM